MPGLLDEASRGPADLLEQSHHYGGIARSGWFYGGEGKVYLRVAQRAPPSDLTRLTPAIDLANVEPLEEYRGTGVLSALFDQIEQTCLATARALYVENVFSDRLHAMLQARGYQIREDVSPPSYWRHPDVSPAASSPSRRPR